MPRHSRTRAILVAAAVVGLGACGPGPPTRQAWLQDWDATTDLVPARSALGERPDWQQCEDVLVDLRRAAPTVLPGPDEVTTRAASAWLSAAEHHFFTCFDEGAEPVGAAYDQLDRLADMVDTAARGD